MVEHLSSNQVAKELRRLSPARLSELANLAFFDCDDDEIREALRAYATLLESKISSSKPDSERLRLLADYVENLGDKPWLAEIAAYLREFAGRVPSEASEHLKLDRLQHFLGRALKLLTEWEERYGAWQPNWLPPAGSVKLREEIDEFHASLSSLTAGIKSQPQGPAPSASASSEASDEPSEVQELMRRCLEKDAAKGQMTRLCDELTYCLRALRATLDTDHLKPFYVRLRDRIDAVLSQASGYGNHQEPTPWSEQPPTKRGSPT